MKLTKCLNEWNAVVEALGQGKQTILIRKMETNVPRFLLYPTVTYVNIENFEEMFKEEYRDFVTEYKLPIMKDKNRCVKYYAEVIKVLSKPYSRIGALDGFHIWTNEHVKSYLEGRPAKIWILRVYKLKKPVMTRTTRSITYANTLKEISIDNAEPVIPEDAFQSLVQKIESKI